MRAAPAAVLSAPLVLLLALAGAPGARAESAPRLTIIEENDSIGLDSDKHYTQGLRLGYQTGDLVTPSVWTAPFAWLPSSWGGPAGGDAVRRYNLSLGQNIFTPSRIDVPVPQPNDRPYAGWLYVGIGLVQETAQHVLEDVELQLGVVGPSTKAAEVQTQWHQFIGAATAQGWQFQLHDEPGLVINYNRKYRFALASAEPIGLDVVPEGGFALGNVYDYASVGGTLRLGTNLTMDYGPPRIRPGPGGTDYMNGDRAHDGLGGYVFVGGQGRLVGRNIFLDDNSFRSSPSIPSNPLVGDLQAGASLFVMDGARLTFAYTRRSEEFKGQRGPDEFVGITLTLKLGGWE
jgi:hypothetical protein